MALILKFKVKVGTVKFGKKLLSAWQKALENNFSGPRER